MKSLQPKTRMEHLSVYWGAKEALYKAYGRKKLEFKQHILVEPFKYNLKKGICKGQECLCRPSETSDKRLL